MRVDEFDYHLPPELIAQEPLPNRSDSRMLVIDRKTGRWEDRHFRDFPPFVGPGDLVVFNNSKVFPSRLLGRRASGTAAIEVFLLRKLNESEDVWEALVRPGRKMPVGERVLFDRGLAAEVLDRGDHGSRSLRFFGVDDVDGVIHQVGHVPLPPYIKREDRPEDRDRYQTIYAREEGSVAAPTAGLHFTPEVLRACCDRGAELAHVTLHVGLGTFAPLHAEHVENIQLHHERFSIPPETVQALSASKRRVAVGTTSVRTLETYGQTGRTHGDTNLFISPGFEFRMVDMMLTNFHLPQSSLLILVAAFAGRELILDAYRYAVEQRYRFFSYGDCMLIL
jgi:S-adenosylmethionine:tRNA ribosyltransferase-isomerase